MKTLRALLCGRWQAPMPETQETLLVSELDDFGRLQITEALPYRFLYFGEQTEQSCCYLPDPAWLEYDYTRAMLLGLFWVGPDSKTALLGLGGGSLANCLLQHFTPRQLTAVELRPAVTALAHAWLGLRHDPALQVVHSCAETWLKESPGGYDLLMVDLYMEGGLSRLQLQGDFFRACRAALQPTGVLVINQWQQRDSGDPYGAAMLREVLGPGTLRTEVEEGNILLFVPAGARLGFSLPAMQRWADDLESRLGYSLRPYLSRLRPL